MRVTREFKVGLITFLALAALIWGLSFLKGASLFQDERQFYAVYDNVDGLGKSGSVNLNGFKVGQVDKIYFHPDGSGRLVVRITMTNDFPIPKNSTAKIYSADLLGEKAINLEPSNEASMASDGDTLQSATQLSLSDEVNRQVAPLRDKAETLMSSIDSIVVLTSGFLNEDTRLNFSQTFESISRSFRTLEHSVKTFDTTLTRSQKDILSTSRSLSEVMGTIADNSDELDATFKNIHSISDSISKLHLKETLDRLNSSVAHIESITQKVNEGDGSLARLLNDPELYEELNRTAEQMNLLMLDLKYNPKRYLNFSLFGGQREYSEEEMLENEEKMRERREERKSNDQED